MKNKIRFIIPRLLVITAVVGIVSLIIGAIFKILLLATILFSVGALIYSKIRKHKLEESYYAAIDRNDDYYLPYKKHAVIPVQYAKRTSKPTIIPIY